MVAAIPAYNYDKIYGGMVIAAPPFNLPVLPFIPVYLFMSNRKRLAKFNESVCKMLFLPYALFFLSIFTVVDILMLPFAYLFSLAHKMKLICTKKTYRPKRAVIADFLVFLLFGFCFMALNTILDMYYFML